MMLSSFIPPFIKLLASRDKELYAYLRGITGYMPHNIEIYKLALVHRSNPVKDRDGQWVNNERLEYLGDAVLDFVVGTYLYKHFPHKQEGFLTSMRSNIVKRDSLNRVAAQFDIESHMSVSAHSKSHNSYIGGNAIEALVGALYLDRGIRRTAKFIEKHIIARFDMEHPAETERNYKSRLIEWTQHHQVSIEFQLIDSRLDEAGNPVFKTAILLGGIFASDGSGYSKKESHQNASRVALERLQADTDFRARVLLTVAAPTPNSPEI